MPYHVYVIRLKTESLQKKKMMKANPGHLPHKPCVYVGSTWHSPETRYQKHLTTKKGSQMVKEFHLSLHKRLTAKQPVFATRIEAETHEQWLAERLRRKGYAVWSN